MHRARAQDRPPFTHEIRDAAGDWVFMGDQGSMEVIFNNIAGINFAGRPEAWLQYMRWMCWSATQDWPGRRCPYHSGAVLKLATVGGQALQEHRLPDTFDADLLRSSND